MIDYSKLKLPYTTQMLNEDEIEYGIQTDYGIHPIFKITGVKDKSWDDIKEIEDGLILLFDKRARCINKEEREWEFYKYTVFNADEMIAWLGEEDEN